MSEVPPPPPLAPPDRDLVEGALARAALAADGEPRGALADDAVWLALMALGGRVRDGLARLLAGTFWGGAAPADAARARGALALLLREQAADVDAGAAERTTATLACVALGCADEAAGRLLQQGLAQLELLSVVRQIPVAARVRRLALEFRFRRLDALPARFVARVQDLLERLDQEALLAVTLRDRAAPEARSRALFHAALAGGDPRLGGLLEALLRAGRPVAARELARVWGQGADARQVAAACGRLARALDGGPWALSRARGRWGLVSSTRAGAGSARARGSGSRGSGGRAPRSGGGTPS